MYLGSTSTCRSPRTAWHAVPRGKDPSQTQDGGLYAQALEKALCRGRASTLVLVQRNVLSASIRGAKAITEELSSLNVSSAARLSQAADLMDPRSAKEQEWLLTEPGLHPLGLSGAFSVRFAAT